MTMNDLIGLIGKHIELIHTSDPYTRLKSGGHESSDGCD
jgi:hypothetical protein